MVYKRRKYHRGDTHLKKGWQTKRRKRDLDETRISLIKCYYECQESITNGLRKFRTTHKIKVGPCSENSLRDLVKKFEETGSVLDKDRSGRPKINDDLKEENAEKLLNQEVDIDKPGQGQFYCIHCSRHFINDQALTEHFRTKVHKRRLKALELEPYSVEDSEKAAGLGSFSAPIKRKIETQPQKPEDSDAPSPKKQKKSP